MNFCSRINPSSSIITALIKRTKFSDAFIKTILFETKRKSLLNEEFNQDEKISVLKETIKSMLLKNTKLIIKLIFDAIPKILNIQIFPFRSIFFRYKYAFPNIGLLLVRYPLVHRCIPMVQYTT